eukprot:5405404-Pyramimonas_sp.AAC.1
MVVTARALHRMGDRPAGAAPIARARSLSLETGSSRRVDRSTPEPNHIPKSSKESDASNWLHSGTASAMA